MPVNEEALAELARQTDGKALTAASVEQLSQVYEDLGRSVTVEKEQVEIGDWFAGAALALLSLGRCGLAGLVRSASLGNSFILRLGHSNSERRCWLRKVPLGSNRRRISRKSR